MIHKMKSRRKPLHGGMWGLNVSGDGGGGGATAAAGDVGDREDLCMGSRREAVLSTLAVLTEGECGLAVLEERGSMYRGVGGRGGGSGGGTWQFPRCLGVTDPCWYRDNKQLSRLLHQNLQHCTTILRQIALRLPPTFKHKRNYKINHQQPSFFKIGSEKRHSPRLRTQPAQIHQRIPKILRILNLYPQIILLAR